MEIKTFTKVEDNQFNVPWIYDRETLQDLYANPDDRIKMLESKKAIDITPAEIRAIIVLKRDLVSSP